jgi:hypothetical protein
MPTREKPAQKQRLQIAEVAAKLVANDSVADYHAAKKKAATQLGNTRQNNLPLNQEIEMALIKYQNLLQTQTQDAYLQALRLKAIEAMKLLSPFKPLLAEPVATGTAIRSSEITLHLYYDPVEQIELFLSAKDIPSLSCEKHVRTNATQISVYPAYQFIADQTPIILIVFTEKDKNLSPVSSISNKAMSMINIEALIKLTDKNTSSASRST